jgi:hypothetical protein
MRLEQKCPCGGELVVVYDLSRLRGGHDTELAEARQQVEKFRRAHRDCVRTRQMPMTTQQAPQRTVS